MTEREIRREKIKKRGKENKNTYLSPLQDMQANQMIVMEANWHPFLPHINVLGSTALCHVFHPMNMVLTYFLRSDAKQSLVSVFQFATLDVGK